MGSVHPGACNRVPIYIYMEAVPVQLTAPEQRCSWPKKWAPHILKCDETLYNHLSIYKLYFRRFRC